MEFEIPTWLWFPQVITGCHYAQLNRETRLKNWECIEEFYSSAPLSFALPLPLMKVVQSLEELKCCLGLKLAHQGVKLVYHESCQPQLTHSFFLHKVYIYSLHRQQNNLQMEKAKLMHQAPQPLFSLSFDDRLQIFDSNVSLTCPNLTHNLFCSHPNHKKI